MFCENECNGVKFFTSDKISVRHGFSTRIGGVSELSHTKSLNLGYYRGDDKMTVLKNLRLFSSALDMPLEAFVSVTQIHSSDVREVGESERGAGIFYRANFECDGYVTSEENVALCVKIADCVPILFSDKTAKIIGAVHAGWRGTAAGVAAECVKKMCALGAKPENITAAIGPSICGDCYEVDEPFREQFSETAGVELAEKFLSPKVEKAGKYTIDLKSVNREILLRAGLCEENIDVSELCTACRDDLFYSHRKSGGERGSLCAVIML